MDSYVPWWIAAFVLVVAELLTGTFYLLVVAIGLACGGVVASLSASTTVQFVVAAFVGLAGVVLLNRWKLRQPVPPATEANLDIGALDS